MSEHIKRTKRRALLCGIAFAAAFAFFYFMIGWKTNAHAPRFEFPFRQQR